MKWTLFYIRNGELIFDIRGLKGLRLIHQKIESQVHVYVFFSFSEDHNAGRD